MFGRAERRRLLASLGSAGVSLVVGNVFVVNHVNSIILRVASGVRAAITPLAIVRPVRCVLRARRQIIAYSRQWSFAHIATLVARYLLKQLHLRLRRNHRASVPRPRLRSHLFAIFCLINSGLLLGLAWLVVSDVDQRPFNYLFYRLTLCFL